jgi:hypothetical protein
MKNQQPLVFSHSGALTPCQNQPVKAIHNFLHSKTATELKKVNAICNI